MRTLRSRLALFSDVRTSSVLDQLEEPDQVLDYAYSQQQVHLRTVKRGLIEVAAALARLRAAEAQLQSDF